MAATAVAEHGLAAFLARQYRGVELADLMLTLTALAGAVWAGRPWLRPVRGEMEALMDGVRPLTPAAMPSPQEGVARVTRLIEEFHQLALAGLCALPCSFAPVQPAALLREVVARVQPRALAAAHAHLFEPLYRIDASRRQRLGGSGLGLAICRAIVRCHGGQIEAGAFAFGALSVVVSQPRQPKGSA